MKLVRTYLFSRSLSPLMMRRQGWLAGLLLLLVLAVGWGVPLAMASPSGPPISPSPGSMNKIFQEPEKYLDREVTVEGTLVAEGRGLAVTFFLRADSGERLQTDAWVPMEVYHPREGKGSAKSMAYYVGRRLLLTGRLQAQGGRIILQVSAAKELP